MIKMYVGGWDCTSKDVKKMIEKGVDPDAVYASYEEACKNAFHDADVEPDEAIYFVFENGNIEEFENW